MSKSTVLELESVSDTLGGVGKVLIVEARVQIQ